MLLIEGKVVNRKRTYRVYCEEGLQVRTKKRKKITPPWVPIVVPDAANKCWSIDFVSNQMANGRGFRSLNVVDDFSREFDRISRKLPKTLDQRMITGNVITTISDRAVHCARNRLERSQRKQPDMLIFPHDPMH